MHSNGSALVAFSSCSRPSSNDACFALLDIDFGLFNCAPLCARGLFVDEIADRNTVCDGFVGQICEVRVWSVCQPLCSLRQKMTSSLRGWELDLRGYWPLIDSDRVVADRSPNGLHGILQGPFSRHGCVGGWSTAPVGGKQTTAALPPVSGHFHSVVSPLSESAASRAHFKSVGFAGPSRLVGLRASLWDSRQPGASTITGAMWLRDRVVINQGFELQSEVTALTDGTQVRPWREAVPLLPLLCSACFLSYLRGL
jgi:hypothetical protein